MPTRIPLCALLALSAIGCSRHAPTAGVAPAAAEASVAASSECLPDRSGYLRLRVRGARNLDIDWRDAELQCDGGPRPGQAGLRLTFARNPSGEPRLRLVLGIAAVPGAGSSREVPANVTLIFEGEQRLYSTRGDDKCTIDELLQTPIEAPARHALRVAGRGFCVAPAAAIGGRDDVLVTRFDFAGRVFDDGAADHPQ